MKKPDASATAVNTGPDTQAPAARNAPAAPSPPIVPAVVNTPIPVSQPLPVNTPMATVRVPAPVEVAPPPPRPRAGPSFHEIDSKLDDRLTVWTEAQKQAYWQSVSGTQITWQGEVQQVEITSGGRITLKCNPETWSSDCHVQLDGSQIARLPQINKSQRVTIQGILTEHNSTGYTITQARVVDL